MGKKRHLTPAEIKEQCKRIARESRMADRTPWTAMGIMLSYVIMRKEGFKGQRISRIANKVNEMEADWSDGKIDLKEISKRLYDKADWTIEYKALWHHRREAAVVRRILPRKETRHSLSQRQKP